MMRRWDWDSKVFFKGMPPLKSEPGDIQIGDGIVSPGTATEADAVAEVERITGVAGWTAKATSIGCFSVSPPPGYELDKAIEAGAWTPREPSDRKTGP